MSERQARLPGGPSRPWVKAGSERVIATGWTIAGHYPWVPEEQRLATYETCVAATSDAAALVEAVRHCQMHGETIPEWITDGLTIWLAEFVCLTARKGMRPRVEPVRFVPWGQAYLRAYRDLSLTDRVETNRYVYGMTWAEAIDETACGCRGTPLASTSDQIQKAVRRARQKAKAGWFKRLPTDFEGRQMEPLFSPTVYAGSSQNYWWVINSDRTGDRKGEWTQRPRKLAHLTPSALERQASEVVAAWERLPARAGQGGKKNR